MKTNAFLYSLKIWVTTAILAPFLQCGVDLYNNKPDYDAGYWITTAGSMGVLLALPSIVLFWLTTLLFRKVAHRVVLLKLLLCLPGIAFSAVMMYLAQGYGEFVKEGPYLPIPYVGCTIVAIWLYEVPILNRKKYNETVLT
jgi:hypothetical protein